MQQDLLYKNYQSTHPCHNQAKIFSAADNRYFAANFKKFLPADKKARILDIGCGAGYFLQYLESLGYVNYLGVDVSKEQIDFCKKRRLVGEAILITNLQKFLSNHKESFDLIMMNDVIEHVKKDEIVDTLASVYQSLRKNGRFIIKTANLKHRWGMTVRYMDFTHTVGFTEESLRQVLFLSGFKTINFIHEVHPIHDIKSFARVVLKSLFEIWHRLEYLASFGDLDVNVSNMLIAVANK